MLSRCVLLWLFLTVSATCATVLESPVPEAPELLADFHYDDDDSSEAHFRLGVAMGKAYKHAVQQRMQANIQSLKSFLLTQTGKRVYEHYLRAHKAQVPHLVRELEGVAEGSGVSFETVFAVSMSQELSYFAPATNASNDDHCSDYTLCTSARCIGGHNEDSNLQDHRLFTAFVRLGSQQFVAVNYVGDLLGGMSALAVNQASLAFSLNRVGPAKATLEGLGRNFVSRLLLKANTLDEAIATASKRHAAGHNYQLFDFHRRRIVNVEVANDRYAVRRISEPVFHVNQYITLVEPNQTYTTSSAHRTARLKVLPIPHTSENVLKTLGDQGDHLYPVFHDAASHKKGELSDWTLATVLFDLDNCTISLMHGNPANLNTLRRFAVPCALQPTHATLLV